MVYCLNGKNNNKNCIVCNLPNNWISYKTHVKSIIVKFVIQTSSFQNITNIKDFKRHKKLHSTGDLKYKSKYLTNFRKAYKNTLSKENIEHKVKVF